MEYVTSLSTPPTRRTLLGALAAAAACGPAAARAQPRDPVSVLWRGIELVDTDGHAFTLDSRAAPATLLHLWAHWCPACLNEMASLAGAASAPGVLRLDVVLVSHPEFWAADQVFARRHALPFRLATPSAANKADVLDAALLEGGAYVVPRSLLFDAAGRGVVWTHSGALPWSAPATTARLRTALAG